MRQKYGLQVVQFGALYLLNLEIDQLPVRFSSCHKNVSNCQMGFSVAKIGQLATKFAKLLGMADYLDNLNVKFCLIGI